MTYVDGFVIPIPKRRLAAYRRLARAAGKVWRDHGALQYVECVGDDLAVHCGPTFPKQLKLKPGEAVLFSFIVYRSRAHRDRVNALAMKDARLTKAMRKGCPFDPERMLFGGFKAFEEA
jgi:uncharacterized protein YbaA (DUF1428 family)